MKLQTILHEAGGLRLQRQRPNVKAKIADVRQQQMAAADKFNTNPPAAAPAAPQPVQPSDSITAANAMEKIPALMAKHADNQEFVKAIVSTVASAVPQGAEVWGQALQQAQDKKNRQKLGIKGSGQKKTQQQQAQDALVAVSNLPPEAKKLFQTGVQQALQSAGTRQRTHEAVQQPAQAQQAQPAQQQAQPQRTAPAQTAQQPAPPAGGINPQAQQAILAQIKAAVRGMTKEQRNVLKARVQQAALLKGQAADPNKLMRHGQPVVGRAGIQRPPGPGVANIAKTGLKKFLGMQ